MSNALITGQLLTFISADLKNALGSEGEDFPVYFEVPRLPTTLGYAVVIPAVNTTSFGDKVGTVGAPQRFDEFHIEIRKPWPPVDGQSIPLAKIDDADRIIAQLQVGSDYHGIAIMPLVTEVDWASQTDPNERSYDFRLRFSVYSAAPHH